MEDWLKDNKIWYLELNYFYYVFFIMFLIFLRLLLFGLFTSIILGLKVIYLFFNLIT